MTTRVPTSQTTYASNVLEHGLDKNGRKWEITGQAPPDWGLQVKEVGDRGRGVFAGKRIPPGELVVRFEGPIYNKDECPDFSEAIQVGVNAWMWSSGGIDDIVNHSCNPNTGLFQISGTTYLMSIKTIEEGDELFFDYSTSMVDEPWDMECYCGDKACRGRIGNFLDMPDSAQQYYAGLGVLPEHVWVTAEARNVILKRGSISPTSSDPSTPTHVGSA